jgi:hypothetical protein
MIVNIEMDGSSQTPRKREQGNFILDFQENYIFFPPTFDPTSNKFVAWGTALGPSPHGPKVLGKL